MVLDFTKVKKRWEYIFLPDINTQRTSWSRREAELLSLGGYSILSSGMGSLCLYSGTIEYSFVYIYIQSTMYIGSLGEVVAAGG